MAAKSEALARQFEAKVQAAVATLERVSDAEWTRVTEAVDAGCSSRPIAPSTPGTLRQCSRSWPNELAGGRRRGRDYRSRLWRPIDPSVEPVRLEDDALGRTVVQVHLVVRDLVGHILADEIVEHVYAVHAGLVGRMDIRRPGTRPCQSPLPGPTQGAPGAGA